LRLYRLSGVDVIECWIPAAECRSAVKRSRGDDETVVMTRHSLSFRAPTGLSTGTLSGIMSIMALCIFQQPTVQWNLTLLLTYNVRLTLLQWRAIVKC
jgi:hypothetical protein